MPRIRTIKPELPQSESVGRLSIEATAVFLLLFTVVDDSGRARGNSRLLASQLFPYRRDIEDKIDAWMAELDRENIVVRYEVDGAVFLEMRNFQKHQKIDKPTASKLPPFSESSRILANPREASATDLVSVSVSGGDRIKALRPLSPDGDADSLLSVKGGMGEAEAADTVQPETVRDSQTAIALLSAPALESRPDAQDAISEGGGDDDESCPEARALAHGRGSPCPALPKEEVPGRPLRRPAVPYERILGAWAEQCPSMPQPAVPTEPRKNKIRLFWQRAERDARVKGIEPMEWVRGFFAMVEASDFLTGRRGRGKGHESFQPDIWWCIQPEKYACTLEGRYDNRRQVG